MSLNFYKIENRKICIYKGWNKINISSLWLCMMEEVGELTASIRRKIKIFPDYKSMQIQAELMDVLSYILQLADMYDIDLDKCWDKYYFKSKIIEYF